MKALTLGPLIRHFRLAKLTLLYEKCDKIHEFSPDIYLEELTNKRPGSDEINRILFLKGVALEPTMTWL